MGKIRRFRSDDALQCISFVEGDKTSTYIYQIPPTAQPRADDNCRGSHVAKGSLVPKASNTAPRARRMSTNNLAKSTRHSSSNYLQTFQKPVAARPSKTLLQAMNLPIGNGSLYRKDFQATRRQEPDFPDVPAFRGYAFFKPQRRSWSGDPFAIQYRRRASMPSSAALGKRKSMPVVSSNTLTYNGKTFAWNSRFAQVAV
eukprot:SAG22_NODE_854_length_6847_cov_3.834469_5_plen_200_part_00